MSDSLPYAAEAEAPLSHAELNVLRKQYEREGKEEATTQTKFNYAWGLIRSKSKSDHLTGVTLFAEIFRDSPERQRECLYYLALGYYKLGEYSQARDYNSRLLELEPNNLQADSLKLLIEDAVSREGKTGLFIVGGAVAIVAALSLYVAKRRNE
ncbi:683_t:CDS:2 [Ambispora gerdemannii]|uniref:Mitochondrial fission 1 protein n=1 Tax=Ambispora gerdemannii TaxID=144530 RepID=A0A9N9FAG9_9GLOM|nr:683_t:CDS:2 [Ambispora gerdemannii]